MAQEGGGLILSVTSHQQVPVCIVMKYMTFTIVLILCMYVCMYLEDEALQSTPGPSMLSHHPPGVYNHHQFKPRPVSVSLVSRSSSQSDTDSGRGSLVSSDNGSWAPGNGYHGSQSPLVTTATGNNNASAVQRLHPTIPGN